MRGWTERGREDDSNLGALGRRASFIRRVLTKSDDRGGPHSRRLEAEEPVHLDDEPTILKFGESVRQQRIGAAVLRINHEQLAPRRVLPR